MFEIKGRFNAAKCYASIIEEEAIGQIFNLCNYEFIKDSHIAIMPDAHAGKGCTIGTTMTITDKVVPNLVGADIGCGMYCVKLGKVEIDFEQFDKAVYKLPSGTSVWNKKQEAFDLTRLICYPFLENVNRLELSLGTLGGGNHFIEIDRSESGDYYLIIHSGSRNLGTQVAKYYQKKSPMRYACSFDNSLLVIIGPEGQVLEGLEFLVVHWCSHWLGLLVSSAAASGRRGVCGALCCRSLRSFRLRPLISPIRTLNPVANAIK